MIENPGFSRDFGILTITKSKAMVPFPILTRLVLRYIFNRDGRAECFPPDPPMVKPEISDMMNSITNYAELIRVQKHKLADKYGAEYVRYLDSQKAGERGTVLGEIEHQLERISSLLRDNDQGKFDLKIAQFKEHRIDYKKHYKLPESFKAEDFVRAQQSLLKAMKDNPEDYR